MPRIRCAKCGRPEGHCLCEFIVGLDSRTRVLILQDPTEAKHALNTGRLAALGLHNAELWVGEVFEALPALLADPGHRPCLLYPGEQAQPLRRMGEDEPAMLLVVPDGTWRKASRLLHLNPVLASLPRVTLEQPPLSRYRVRKAPAAYALSTVEAITLALNALEAPRRFDELLRPFEVLIERQITAMGEVTYRRNHLRDGQG